MPAYLPEHPYLKDMEPLGWIHTQPSETGQLSPLDASTHAKLLENRQDWDLESTVVATCSFTQGSCSLSVYKLTPEGLDWAIASKEGAPNPEGFGPTCFQRVQIILSSKFLGFFMVPANGGLWNYNFNGINFSENMKYSLVVDNPKDFYCEMHRTQHFLDFTAKNMDDESEDNLPDRDDNF